MGVYLTYVNNPKSDVAANTFPDENYAREVMQLFTIGLYELAPDGSRIVDADGEYIPTYDNDDISEFSKIFTGLTWADRTQWNRNSPKDTSYTLDLDMRNEYHEPGSKTLLNGFIVPDRNPVDGDADISDALDNLFNHPNVGPFIGSLLIQRLVTSNPSADYIARVSAVFEDNGEGVRGDMKAVVKAILLDPEAIACSSADNPQFGRLQAPFKRYVHMNRAFKVSTLSGNFRNDMDYIYRFTQQKPMNSPSVFNFYQYDHQPLGPVTDQDLVAPEFQIANSETIKGWVNAAYRFIIKENIADEYRLYTGEDNTSYEDEKSILDFSAELLYTDDINLHILVDRLNLLLAAGQLSEVTTDIIKSAIEKFPNITDNDKKNRVKTAIYLVVSSPEYLIIR